MGDAGFFRGTSSDQDGRFSDKEKKLLKQMKFEETLERKINMDKINLDVIKPWITMRINEILGMEDDVVIEYIMSQLEEKTINPKIMQINITGFLNARRAREFMGELWVLLVEADEADDGIPRSLIDKKLNEMKRETPRNGDSKPEPVNTAASDWQNRYQTLSGGRYSGPTREKEVRDDRIGAISPKRGGTPPRHKDREREIRDKEKVKDGTPPRRRAFDEREKEKEKDREKRRLERREEEKKREEERLKRRAEEKERDRRREEDRERERERRREEERERERRRRRSRSRSRSPIRRRFTEGGSSHKRRRSPSDSEDDDDSRKKKKKKRVRRSSDESDYERRDKKEKKIKKHKKEKKKKERKRSPTPSSASDTE